jgi:hypothetical protein
MKATILAGALAALTYGTAALAQDEGPMQDEVLGEESQAPDSIVIEPVDPSLRGNQDMQGIGGSGSQDIGGSGDMGLNLQQGEVLLRCEPAQGAIGGSGSLQGSGNLSGSSDLQGSVGLQDDVQQPLSQDVVVDDEDDEAFGGAGREEDRGGDKRGLTVMLGGGIEGYTNALAPQISPGPAVGVTASFKPTSVLGIEVGYSGAVNNLDTGAGEGATDGPDLIRNGGHAVATFGLMASDVQPYILGGIGVSRYNVRGGFSRGFDDDTVGQVPVGAGLRTHIGNFTADARLNYNFLFDQEFAANVPERNIGAPGDSEFSEGGSYAGTINLGVTF